MRTMNVEDRVFFMLCHFNALTPAQQEVVEILIDELAGRPHVPIDQLPDNVVPLRALTA
jgi:hypothetical protein